MIRLIFLSPVISLGIPSASDRSSSSLYSLKRISILSRGINVSVSFGIMTSSSRAIKTIRQCGGRFIFPRGLPTDGELSLNLTSRILSLPTEKCSKRVSAGLDKICHIRCIANSSGETYASTPNNC